MDFVKMEAVIKRFGNLKLRGERPETFVEIAGHPRRERVCSNMLAYFLDPGKPHGLRSMVLQTFCKLSGHPHVGEFGDVEIKVESEKRTGSGKFIDLLVETEELVLLIENKIDARVNNPLDEYAAYLNEISDGREQIKILLTVNPSNAGIQEGFMNLTYSKLVAELESNLGKHAAQADARLLTFFLDFMNTMENLRRGTRMDPKLIEFLAVNQDEIQELLYKVDELNSEMKSKRDELRKFIGEPEHENVTQHSHGSEYEISKSLALDIWLHEGFVVRIDTTIYPKGWDIWIWPHTGNSEGIEDLSELRKILKKLEIPVEEWSGDDGYGFLHEISYWSKSQPLKDQNKILGYDAEISEVAEIVQDVVKKLSSA